MSQQPSVGRYRKRPVEVDAVRVTEAIYAAGHDWRALPEWLREAYDAQAAVLFLPGAIEIRTLEGTMRADCGDWLIRGVKGEIYPCKPDIFEATYEAADEQFGSVTMALRFDDADPVATCGECGWHAHGDSIRDAVLAWTGHLTNSPKCKEKL